MKKATLLFALLCAFGLGYAFNAITTTKAQEQSFRKVTGIGGVFFKSKDPKALKAWYKKHLGLNTGQYGTVFSWYQGADSTKKGYTQWSPFKETTNYFEPSQKEFMINYRVADLTRLVTALKAEGVTICDTMETYDYGKFIHILDLENNKIELWEPNDEVYGRFTGELTK
jgi:predicted enzyme related to lactoylglutathione lyase